MSESEVRLSWARADGDFDYKTYDRTHFLDFSGGVRVLASASPGYYGDGRLLNPEQGLIGAMSSCFMLTFLAIASLKGLVVDAYSDEADGELDRNEDNRNYVSRIVLRPRASFAEGKGPESGEALMQLYRKAHRSCFIANSVVTQVDIEPRDAGIA
ncbi:MAG TPA: OsmC family protein [Gammaproteobacteria bacterium]|nr:OsmC family protein [Gammaproteobacteria bacterium]